MRHGWIVISLLQPQPEGEIVIISLSTNGVNALSFLPHHLSPPPPSSSSSSEFSLTHPLLAAAAAPTTAIPLLLRTPPLIFHPPFPPLLLCSTQTISMMLENVFRLHVSI